MYGKEPTAVAEKDRHKERKQSEDAITQAILNFTESSRVFLPSTSSKSYDGEIDADKVVSNYAMLRVIPYNRHLTPESSQVPHWPTNFEHLVLRKRE